MTIAEFVLFVLIGCGVGFLAGLFGVGGGFIMIPALILGYEYSGVPSSILTHLAIGTSLFVVIFSGMTSAYQQTKQRNIDWQAVFIIGFSSALTAFASTRLTASMSGRHLRIAFAIIVIAASLQMLLESQAKAERKLVMTSPPSKLGLLVIGITAGVVSAFAGIGGGLFTIPMMYNFLNYPLKLAIGTSSATIVITAFFSALAIGSILLARVGAYVSYRTHPDRLKKLFAIFVILMALYLLVK
jgi:uncharacterized membrane protein YfcA